jgi:hypothetical protein
MKITLAMHGGHAAEIFRRLPPQVVDVDALPPAEAEELMRLVAAAKAAPAPQEERAGAADVTGYTITVEEGGQPIVLQQSDMAMSRPFAALLNWIQEHAAK